MAWRPLVYRLLSRTLRRVYRTVPVFGPLPGAVAVIRDGPGYVVIERSDGLGLSFPGGLRRPWESDEEAVRREAREETGLTLGAVEWLFRYDDSSIAPSRISVFRAQARRTAQSSWEGRVLTASLEDLRARITSAEAPIVRYLLAEQ